ncbi:MAG: formate/nitrite transporter family protein [Mailhella sp.]|nr:formate/nitrite transporter family protein [Mailhella sp.]
MSLSFTEMTDVMIAAGVKKSGLPTGIMFVLALLGGAFIALAGAGSNMAAFSLLASPESYGIGRLVAGLIFPIGLIMVVIGGAELFTGNALMASALARRRISVAGLARNWVIVYFGNMIGATFVAWAAWYAGQFSGGGGLLGGVTVKIAAGKTALGFGQAFVQGIMCNWLVCLAVWMAFGARGTASKCLAIFFPICLFVTNGYEHCIANMYYIPAGLFAKAEFSGLAGVAQNALDGLTWGAYFVNNLVPVTLGNIVGGSLFVGLAYLFAYGAKPKA